MSEAHPFPAIDPELNQIMLVIGRKGSGKSAFAFETFRGWPYIDKFVIDPTGDADPGADIGTVTVREVPTRLPAPAKRGEFTVTRYVPDPSKPTYREDMDRAVGAALFPKDRRVLLWVDEAGEVFPSNGKIGPNAAMLLRQSRHYYASVLLCCPRPITIDPLCLAQADRVVIYDLPNPADRARVAAAIGIDPKEFNAALDETRARGPYWYLLYVAKEHELYRCPPLPLSTSYRHAQQ